MRLTTEQKSEIVRLKRSGVGYRTIASKMGFRPSTVSSFCQRSGLFADNPVHRALFTIPEPRFSSVPALTKPLPPQKVITGHKQTDAYLWVLEVIKLNEPAHLSAAEAALEKLTINPKDAEKRYRDWMAANGADIFQTAFGTIFMDDPQHFLKRARENIRKASEVRAVFGSYEAAIEPVEAEQLISRSIFLVDENFGLTEEEVGSGHIYGIDRYMELEDARKNAHHGFTDVLPSPHTLSDVVREFEYWKWLYWMRDAAAGELGLQHTEGLSQEVYDREDWLDTQLATISPIYQQEAVNVLKWLLKSDRHEGRDCMDAILMNLMAVC
ncbi:helix-turn-helix domain-containing protein [Klebsiella oxytoca]|uniref:helix-turn-helix domain-containing protein n=1 Tax=Klebsiella oxytoca TaxID=571 RepID=UPI0025511426|nr:helix-turn-helix domain-containing protein [Klebsiella oxytoca]MDK6509602.1 helix-turn-helix domain-containing protein [Klebsiella oxytoca]MDK8026528.1 helix-turn-helix domain-containing protein [Klebsiella oxytoca]